jgi:hypothetical protein
MNHSDERINWNWVCQDQPRLGLPFLNKNNQDKDQSALNYIDNLRVPTVTYAKKSIQNPLPEITTNCDDCFIASTKQYKNLYIQIATTYAQRMNKDQNCKELLEENSPTRQILAIAGHTIAEIEKHTDNRPIYKEMVNAIGQLASQFIDLSLRYKRTDGLIDLFNEGLNCIIRSNEMKVNPSHPQPTRCILEECEPVSDNSSGTSSVDTSLRTICHLTDWYGESSSSKHHDSEKGWIWSERSKSNQKRNCKRQQ